MAFRRERREMASEMIKNIIGYHLSSKQSMSEDGLEGKLSNSDDDPITMNSTISYLPSMNINDHVESVRRSICTLDKNDMLTDGFCESKSDSSFPWYENALVSVRNATAQLMDFAIDSNLNKSVATKLFRLVKNLLPISNALPATHTQILTVLGQVSLFHAKFYCNRCNKLCVTRSNKEICDN